PRISVPAHRRSPGPRDWSDTRRRWRPARTRPATDDRRASRGAPRHDAVRVTAARAVRALPRGGPRSMIVIRAIVVRAGGAVRLLRGDPNEETAYDDDPVEVAVRFPEEGARGLRLVGR